jgi:hypothetical protein
MRVAHARNSLTKLGRRYPKTMEFPTFQRLPIAVLRIHEVLMVATIVFS